jgi:hypothetical protein
MAGNAKSRGRASSDKVQINQPRSGVARTDGSRAYNLVPFQSISIYIYGAPAWRQADQWLAVAQLADG